MAEYQSHITFSSIIALGYGFVGFAILGAGIEHIALACILVVISGMMPDIDASGAPPARELAALLAAVAPIMLLEYVPVIREGGIARVALAFICCYLITRWVVVRGLQKLTVHRGMVHSVPAAIIITQALFILFADLRLPDRLYVSSSVFIGYLSHLVLDAYGNLDLVGKAMGNERSKKPALKFLGSSWASTIAIYACVIILGWMIAKEFYPGLRIDVRY